MLTRSFPMALLLALCFTSLAMAAQPRIELDQADFDFGRIFQGEKVARTFRFQNAGDAPLSIDRVRSSCGCTVPRLSAELVAPGDVAEVEAVFDSSRFKGRVVKTIYLYTNDPQQEVVQLTLRGVVEEVIAAEPPRVDFGVIKPGEQKKVSVGLSNRSKIPVTLGAITVTNPAVQVSLSGEALAAGGEVSLAVTAVPEQDRGRLSGYVIIPTDHPNVPEVRLPIFGTIAP